MDLSSRNCTTFRTSHPIKLKISSRLFKRPLALPVNWCLLVVALLQAASLQPVPVGWGQISRIARLAGSCSDSGAFDVTAYTL